MDSLIRPWREVAERHGFRLAEGRAERGEYIEYLASGATWLDLASEANGFRSAKLVTWIDGPEGRFSLTTFGEAIPRPRGPLGWFGDVVAGLLHRLGTPPTPMRSPADLGTVIQKHTGELLAISGKPLRFKTLEERFEQERRDQALAARQKQ